MPDHDFESTLVGQLRAYADGGVRPIDRYAIAEATIAAPRSIRQRWSLGLGHRGLVPVLAGLLLLLALAATALLAGSHLLKPSPVARSAYDAILLRPVSDAPGADLDVIAVRPDGRERLVRHLTASMLPDGRTFLTGGSTSPDGWLAVGTCAPAAWPRRERGVRLGAYRPRRSGLGRRAWRRPSSQADWEATAGSRR